MGVETQKNTYHNCSFLNLASFLFFFIDVMTVFKVGWLKFFLTWHPPPPFLSSCIGTCNLHAIDHSPPSFLSSLFYRCVVLPPSPSLQPSHRHYTTRGSEASGECKASSGALERYLRFLFVRNPLKKITFQACTPRAITTRVSAPTTTSWTGRG